MTTSPATAERFSRTRFARGEVSLWFTIVSVVLITSLHYMTDAHLIPYHSIYRSLFYIPIAIAAVRYGRTGGAFTALLIAIVYIPHVLLSWGAMPTDGLNDLLETGLFLFVGIFAGTLSDAERAQRRRAQEAVAQLATANARLQEQAEQAERTRAQIASILESLDSGIITLDSSRRLITANPAARTLLADLGTGTNTLPELLRSYLDAGGRGYRHVVTGARTLGLHAAPLHGARKEVLGTVLVLDDLTERKALEDQVQRAQRLAALGRLAGGLAHEIRNPLGIVRASAQLLHSELGSNMRLGEYTQVIQSEVDRVDRLIEQLLAYARPQALARGPVEPAELVGRVATLTRAYAAQQGVTLEGAIDRTTPQVDGDPERLHQALVNLLMNAIQATPPGGMVAVTLARDDAPQPAALLTVRDTGRGIEADDLARIFDPFFTTRDDGVGLGLSIVQQVAQEHGGTIDVTSTPGVGSTFVLRLPAPGVLVAEQSGDLLIG